MAKAGSRAARSIWSSEWPIFLAELHAVAARFHGLDIQYRRDAPWQGRLWRIRIYSAKNERQEYRVEMFGDTFEEAAAALLHVLRELDLKWRASDRDAKIAR